MKGLTPLQTVGIFLAVIAFIAVIMTFAWFFVEVRLAAPPPIVPAVYDGEFDDAFLATKGPFYSDFTEQVDCNITNDVLGYNWNSCIYRTRIALNATADSSVDSRDWQLCIAFDIDGDVGPGSQIDVDTGAGTASTGKPTDDLALKEVKLWTHEDEPTLIVDLTPQIEDQQDIDSVNVGPLTGDEYVLCTIWHSKTISPDFTTGDDIARIKFELDTTEDVDTAQVTAESA